MGLGWSYPPSRPMSTMAEKAATLELADMLLVGFVIDASVVESPRLLVD